MGETRKYIIKLVGDFGSIGMTISLCIFIGVGAGHYLDKNILASRYEPWPTLIGLALGVAAAFKNLYDLATRQEWKDDQKD